MGCNEIVAEKDRKEMQGSCVPLIAPGFDFWEATNSRKCNMWNGKCSRKCFV